LKTPICTNDQQVSVGNQRPLLVSATCSVGVGRTFTRQGLTRFAGFIPEREALRHVHCVPLPHAPQATKGTVRRVELSKAGLNPRLPWFCQSSDEETDDTLEGDAFPYHQSIIPSKGSIRGSVFNLAGATLGAGALSLPYAVAVSGLGFAIAQLMLASVLTVYTIRLLIRAGDLTKYVA
jgi:hypothetical protein